MPSNLQVKIQILPFDESYEKAEGIIEKICESQRLRNADVHIEVLGVRCARSTAPLVPRRNK